MIRNCDYCQKQYSAKPSDLKRGWGKCCCKSCASHKREESKPGYNPMNVIMNNERRNKWNEQENNFDLDDDCFMDSTSHGCND